MYYVSFPFHGCVSDQYHTFSDLLSISIHISLQYFLTTDTFHTSFQLFHHIFLTCHVAKFSLDAHLSVLLSLPSLRVPFLELIPSPLGSLFNQDQHLHLIPKLFDPLRTNTSNALRTKRLGGKREGREGGREARDREKPEREG